jgi:glucose 1-dehydrogenase
MFDVTAMSVPQSELGDRYPHKPLAGQCALVTGANSGIGESVARHLAAAGAKVVVNYVTNQPQAQAIIDDINANGGVALALQADVSKEDQVQAMFQEMFKAWGTIDILVNNAGLQKDSPFHDMTLDQWNTVIGINLTGQFLCAREAVREFLRRGMKPDISAALGKIICMSSVHEVIPWGGHANYATSKGGVQMFMKTLAQEYGPQKIRVNAIGPGAIKTPINTSAWNTPEAEQQLLKLIPYNRVGVTPDIARAAVWLASDESDYVTGTTLFVDGAMTCYPGFATGG